MVTLCTPMAKGYAATTCDELKNASLDIFTSSRTKGLRQEPRVMFQTGESLGVAVMLTTTVSGSVNARRYLLSYCPFCGGRLHAIEEIENEDN